MIAIRVPITFSTSARALADAQPDQMVYQYQVKDPKTKAKEKSKPPVLNTNQSLLVTYMVWYVRYGNYHSS